MRTIKMMKKDKFPIPRTFLATESIKGGIVVAESSFMMGEKVNDDQQRTVEISRHVEIHQNLPTFLHEKVAEGYRVYYDSEGVLIEN